MTDKAGNICTNSPALLIPPASLRVWGFSFRKFFPQFAFFPPWKTGCFTPPWKPLGFLPGGWQEVRGWAGRRSLIRRRRGELIERRHGRWLGSWLSATRCLHQTWRGVGWVWEGGWGSTCSPTLAMVTGLPLHSQRCQRRSGISFPPTAHLWAVYEIWSGFGAGSWLAGIQLCRFFFFLCFWFDGEVGAPCVDHVPCVISANLLFLFFCFLSHCAQFLKLISKPKPK